jgi:hypothetical protein
MERNIFASRKYFPYVPRFFTVGGVADSGLQA